MKIVRAILIGVMIWILGVSAYTISFFIPMMDDAEQQANIALFLCVMPLVWLGSAYYYKKDNSTHGYIIGQTFLLVSAALDALITVPLFMVPNGINHYDFFTSLGFWLIAAEFVCVVVLYYYTKVHPRTIKLIE